MNKRIFRAIGIVLGLMCTGGMGSPAREEARLLTNVRQVTFVGTRAGEGYFSQDGTLMVFQSEREPTNPFFQIYLMDLRNGETRRVSPGYGKATCGWIHPSQEKILFASTHEDPQAQAKQQAERDQRAAGKTRRYTWDFDEQFDLFETDLSGRWYKNLTGTLGYDAEGVWSPDGKQIVFASNRHAYSGLLSEEEATLLGKDPSVFVDLYAMEADGTQVRRLTRAAGYDGGPFVSADGRRIVWRRFTVDGATAEIFVMNIDGTEERQITRLGALSWAPYFHPSGDYVIFATNVHGMDNFELYLVDSAGSAQPVRVTYTEGFDGLPVFTPDGTRLAWTSTRTPQKQSQIFFAEWNDAEARRLLGLAPLEHVHRANAAGLTREADRISTTPAEVQVEVEALRRHVTTLASEEMNGRRTGTQGEELATAYAASVFAALGLIPAGDRGTFFQSFEFTAGVSLGPANRLSLHSETDPSPREYLVDAEWRPLAFSRTGVVEPSAVVFAGYGIVAPAAEGFPAYDSFAGLDVTDKWVMVFRYLPEKIAPDWRRHLNRYANLRYKAMLARDRGARGIIVVSGPNARVEEQLVRLSFDASLTGTSVAAISISDSLAARLLAPAERQLQELQDALDTGQPLAGFLVPGLMLGAQIDIRYEKRTGRNVLARLQADGAMAKEMVIIGAHIDHLGDGVGTGSLARGDQRGKIHYGADDNASGVAGVLEIARWLAREKTQGRLSLQRDILFALWSGEEIGLLGSTYFTRTFGGEERANLSPEVVAYLNMDMIGRLDNTLILQGVGSSPFWLREIERQNVQAGLPIRVQDDSYLPTDATPFYLKGVPILSAFTGAHEDYHTPGDTADKINYAGVARISSFMGALTRTLATGGEIPTYVKVEAPRTPMSRGGLRVYLGTIPDYAQSEVVGVRLSGVVQGGPADQAGVQGGDIIVELAGKKIENIYDYTYGVESLQVGVPVRMVVQRGGQLLSLTVTPRARD
ncbi:MAG: M28 family peptidase [Candidatus Binatia bacterium]|nr:M28 family peptidase [Candidatus Binatia bacterium]